MRFLNIKTILNKYPGFYKDMFNFGRIEIDIVDDHTAKVRLYDCATTEYSCVGWTGAFLGTLEQTKTKGTVEETQCQFKGAEHCEFLLKWE